MRTVISLCDERPQASTGDYSALKHSMDQAGHPSGAPSRGLQDEDAQSSRGPAVTQDPKREYASRIRDYANLTAGVSLHAGVHFEQLANYLNEPFNPRPPIPVPDNLCAENERPFKFVSVLDLNPELKDRKPKHLDSVLEFDGISKNLFENSNYGHFVFIRGHPSPEWLLSIGARYQIDPEFFQRHLDFRLGPTDYFPLPSLPSTSISMTTLRVTTLGDTHNVPSSTDTQKDLEALQKANSHAKKSYRAEIRNHASCKLGDSIVRDCSIHDISHFSIEQDISVHVCKTRNSWVGEFRVLRKDILLPTKSDQTSGLIWLDHGKDLSAGLAAAFCPPMQKEASWRIKWLPVVQHKPGVALKQRSKLLAPVSTSNRGRSNAVQSASLLHLDYGRGLDRQILAVDPFYALQELFSFAAFSEVQFLNMLESKLKKELDQSVLVRQKNPTISNLLYNQQVLDRHIERIRDNLSQIRKRDLPQFALDSTAKERVGEVAASIQRDYQYLFDRALGLSEQCRRGMEVVMNNAMIKESREAMSQAEGVAKLTRLAFCFIPLSFTTSFFGMNFLQFGTGTLTIWVWFVASFPVLVISLLFMQYDVSEVLRYFYHEGMGKAGSA